MFGTGGRPLSPKTVNVDQADLCAKSPKERGAKEPAKRRNCNRGGNGPLLTAFIWRQSLAFLTISLACASSPSFHIARGDCFAEQFYLHQQVVLLVQNESEGKGLLVKYRSQQYDVPAAGQSTR